MRKKLLRGLLCLLLALALAVGGYVIYVFAAYYRVEDNQILEVQTIHDYGLDRELRTGEEYRLASYNIGFGAYSDDYSFFMDGGRESRARSPEAVWENVSGAMSAVGELDPDLLLLQEVEALEDFGYTAEQCGNREISRDEVFETIVEWNGGISTAYRIKIIISRVYGVEL